MAVTRFEIDRREPWVSEGVEDVEAVVECAGALSDFIRDRRSSGA
jgi:hypothetical protein